MNKPCLIIPVSIWAAGVVAIIVAAVLLTGCATEPEVWERVCWEHYRGKGENGMNVVRHFCVKPEAVQQQ